MEFLSLVGVKDSTLNTELQKKRSPQEIAGFFISILKTIAVKIIKERIMNKGPLEFLAHKKLINAGKVCLELLEDLELDYNDSQNKLLETIEKFPLDNKEMELLKQIVYTGSIFTDNKKSILRKRILDVVNNASREMEEEFKKYNISL